MTEWLDRKLYPNHHKNWDDRLFRETILHYLKEDSAVLDLGAGAGIVAAMDFRGHASRICGVDLDPRVEQNPLLHEGKVSDAGEIPYDAETFDVVFSDNVMEHLSDPASALREAWRVLKPNGVLLFKTPNKFHYMPAIARWTPHRFHQFINRLRGRSEADTFPTLYRINSRQAVIKFASDVGFRVEKVSRIEGRPEYLRFNPVTYLLGAAYERLVNSSKLLEPFRVLLVAELRRPEP